MTVFQAASEDTEGGGALVINTSEATNQQPAVAVTQSTSEGAAPMLQAVQAVPAGVQAVQGVQTLQGVQAVQGVTTVLNTDALAAQQQAIASQQVSTQACRGFRPSRGVDPPWGFRVSRPFSRFRV